MCHRALDKRHGVRSLQELAQRLLVHHEIKPFGKQRNSQIDPNQVNDDVLV